MNQKKSRTLLLLCRCGTNIAGSVDLDAVAGAFKDKEGVCAIETHDLLCSPAGKTFAEEAIKKNKPDHVVVAACSPKMHDLTFRAVGEKAGMNMAMIQMANIREQAAWVTADKKEATDKTVALINAACERSLLHEKLTRESMEVLNDVVVIGGGIAGIEAALMLANAGRNVTIIEKEISLGGRVIKTEEVAPEMECAPCMLAPRLSTLRDKKNIKVISNAEVTDVLGFFGNFTVKVSKKARYVKDNCIGCEACFEVCPVSHVSPFHDGLGSKKAIYTEFPGSVPAAAAINRDVCKHFTDGSCDACVAVCPFQSVNFDDKDEKIEIQAGAVIAATGFDTFDPSAITRLGHGKIDNVLTLSEFERIASSNGPTGGEVKLKNGQAPASVAIVNCVGSLTGDGVPYCSGICCMNAAKAGDLLRKKVPGVSVHNLHDRLVFDTPHKDRFLRHQVKEGTKFVKVNDLGSVKVTKKGDKIEVAAAGMQPVTVDMVLLATASVPAKGTPAMAALFNANLTADGFFKPDHLVLHATGTSIDGIYAAGGCASPCDVGSAITRAQAAAGDCLARLVPGRKIELETMVSVIDADLCAGCKLCIAVCPYKAIAFDTQKAVSVINEAICRGCGTCAATCPGLAAEAKHFTNEQIHAEIGGIFNG